METNTPMLNMPTSMATPVQQNMPSESPMGAKVIAVLFYIASIAFILLGIMLVFISSISLQFLGSFGLQAGLVPGVACIAWGILSFFAGRGLWSAQQWGKVLAITMSSLYIIFGVINLVKLDNTNYISLVINLVIVAYLLFSKSVTASLKPDSSKTTAAILAILAIIVYTGMQYQNYLAPKNPTVNYFNDLNETLKSGAIKPKGDTNLNQNINPNPQGSNSTQSQGISPNSGSTNGQVYTNSAHNFQFTYPQGTTIQEDNQETKAFGYYDVWVREANQLPVLYMRIRSAENKSLDDLINENRDPKVYTYQQTNTQVAGKPAVRVEVSENGIVQSVNYYFINSDYFYRLSGSNYSPELEMLNSMISSFKFTQ